MLSIYFVWYNIRRRMTLKETSAVASGLTGKTWIIKRMLKEIAGYG